MKSSARITEIDLGPLFDGRHCCGHVRRLNAKLGYGSFARLSLSFLHVCLRNEERATQAVSNKYEYILILVKSSVYVKLLPNVASACCFNEYGSIATEGLDAVIHRCSYLLMSIQPTALRQGEASIEESDVLSEVTGSHSLKSINDDLDSL